MLYMLCLLVVEIDPPYDSRHLAEYGSNFKAWQTEDYAMVSQAITAVFKPFFPTVLVFCTLS